MIQRGSTGEASRVRIEGKIPKPSRPGAQVFRDIAAYTHGRQVVGTTLLEVPLLGHRRVHLWTLEDDEHVLILEQDRSFQYWEASLETVEAAKKRACDWLTEPPSAVL
jgi:hypothetical protein